MNRRTILKIISTAAAGSTILPAAFLSGCQKETYIPKFFSETDLLLLHEIGETILPETEASIGAKSLKVGHFMDTYVADCFTLEHQEIVSNGLIRFQEQAINAFGYTFIEMEPRERLRMLVDLDKAAREVLEPIHYFALLKSLVLFTYFTSETVSKEVLRYLPIPGKYIGDYPLQQGETAWAL